MALSVTLSNGFVATTMDAAYIVQAAATDFLPRVDTQPDAGYSSLVRSGVVIVQRTELDDKTRIRDDYKWSKRRTLGNGFDIYREFARDPNERITNADIANETANKAALRPYMASWVGSKAWESKRNGLIKKTINIQLGGYKYRLLNYYSLADVQANRLTRPRAALPALLPRSISLEHWRQPHPGSGQNSLKVVMVDDGGASTASQWQVWSVAGPVAAFLAAPFPVAPALAAAPAVAHAQVAPVAHVAPAVHMAPVSQHPVILAALAVAANAAPIASVNQIDDDIDALMRAVDEGAAEGLAEWQQAQLQAHRQRDRAQREAEAEEDELPRKRPQNQQHQQPSQLRYTIDIAPMPQSGSEYFTEENVKELWAEVL